MDSFSALQLSALISDSVPEIEGVHAIPPSSVGQVSAFSASLALHFAAGCPGIGWNLCSPCDIHVTPESCPSAKEWQGGFRPWRG